MGKWILLVVGAATLGVNYLLFSGQRMTIETREQQSDFQYQDIANNAVTSGFDRAVSAIKRDMMAAPDSFQRVTMGDGYYDLRIDKNLYGDLTVNATAHSGEASYSMEGHVIFTADLPAAVQLEDEAIAVSGGGNYQISGVDRRMPARGAGAGFRDPIRGVMTTYSNRAAFTNTLNMNRVLGIGGSPDDPVNENSVVGGFEEAEYEALYQEARLSASTTISTHVEGVLREAMLRSAVSGSSPGNPQIVRVQGDLTITESVQGFGMLLIEDGDLIVAAPDFDWEGLIMVRKHHEDTVRVNLNNTTLHGGLVAYDFDPATALPECVPDFDIHDDYAIVNEPFRIRFKVLGAAISAGGTYDVPVTTRINMGDSTYEPWGDYDLALDGNINTGNSGVTYSWEPDTVFPAGTNVSIDAQSWLKYSGYDGDQNSEWYVYLERNSNDNDQQLKMLENGASVPAVGGFMGQYSVEEFLADYLNNDRMKLTANQVVNLFELGATDTGSEAFDMQDAVVLVTLIRGEEAGCVASASSSRLEVNIGNNTKIHYSSEAIAKLGSRLNTVASRTTVRLASTNVKGQGKDEVPVFVDEVPDDDQEDQDENEGDSSNRVTICHRPKNNGGITKSIKDQKLAKHLSHGDYIGDCTGWDPDA